MKNKNGFSQLKFLFILTGCLALIFGACMALISSFREPKLPPNVEIIVAEEEQPREWGLTTDGNKLLYKTLNASTSTVLVFSTGERYSVDNDYWTENQLRAVHRPPPRERIYSPDENYYYVYQVHSLEIYRVTPRAYNDFRRNLDIRVCELNFDRKRPIWIGGWAADSTGVYFKEEPPLYNFFGQLDYPILKLAIPTD